MQITTRKNIWKITFVWQREVFSEANFIGNVKFATTSALKVPQWKIIFIENIKLREWRLMSKLWSWKTQSHLLNQNIFTEVWLYTLYRLNYFKICFSLMIKSNIMQYQHPSFLISIKTILSNFQYRWLFNLFTQA